MSTAPRFRPGELRPIRLRGIGALEGIGLIARRRRLGAVLAGGALVLALAGAVHPAAADGQPPRFVRIWAERGAPLPERTERTRTAALELGLRNVEPAARLLLASPPPEGRLEGARAAARLAPDLPAAQIGLAFALWSELDVFGGISALAAAVGALRRNLEASLWLHASAAWAAAMALVCGSLLYLLLTAALAARRASHDLGDRLSVRTPDFSRAALLGSVLLLPAALGEGLLGLGLTCLVLIVSYGSRRQALPAGLAALAIAVGLHPLLVEAGRALGAFQADPVAVAAHAAEHGLASPMDLARLEGPAESDPLAARALAMGVKRTGDLEEADARYAELMAEAPDDPVLLNNAANVRLALGDTEGAIALYERSLARRESAVTWFNLSQAWGVALNVMQLDAALARAQELDGNLVQDLSEIQDRAIHFVADLPVPGHVLRRRLLAASDGRALGRELRRPLAPGLVGRDLAATAAALAGAIALGLGLRASFRPSRGCERCRALVCPRCHHATVRRTLCETCHRLLYQPEGTDRGLRIARADAVRRRGALVAKLSLAASLLVPGAAGPLAGRPLAGLLSCLAAAAVASCALAARGVVPDPLAAGAAGPLVFGAAAALAGSVYLVALLVCLASRGGD